MIHLLCDFDDHLFTHPNEHLHEDERLEELDCRTRKESLECSLTYSMTSMVQFSMQWDPDTSIHMANRCPEPYY